MRKLKPEKQFYKKRLLDPSQQFCKDKLATQAFFYLHIFALEQMICPMKKYLCIIKGGKVLGSQRVCYCLKCESKTLVIGQRGGKT